MNDVFLLSMIVGALLGGPLGVAAYYWRDGRRFKRQHPELLDENGKVKPFPYRTAGEQLRNPYDW